MADTPGASAAHLATRAEDGMLQFLRRRPRPGHPAGGRREALCPFFTTKKKAWAWASTSAAPSPSCTGAALSFWSPIPDGGTIFRFYASRPQPMGQAFAHIVDDGEAIRDALTWLFPHPPGRLPALGIPPRPFWPPSAC